MDIFKLNRRNLSALYIAVLISFLILQLINPLFQTWTANLANLASGWFNIDFRTNGRIWIVFILTALIVAIAVRQFFVIPLGFFIDSDDGNGWESAILLFLIVGFYIYLLNQIFDYAMPLNAWWMPNWLIRFLGGNENTFFPNLGNGGYVETWPINWFWYLAPPGFLYFRTKIIVQ